MKRDGVGPGAGPGKGGADGRPQWAAEPLGDGAVLLRRLGPVRPGDMAEAAERLRLGGLPWLAEAVPAYDSIALQADPAATVPPSVMAASALELLRDWRPGRREARTVRIPVVYGGPEGPDLEEAAARSGLSPGEFAARHASAVYEVAAIGFAPGFPYLAGLPEELAQPRRDVPRLRVPAGSVGIAGRQTGIYPVDSPGGWTLIGRTPFPLFRPHADDPFPLRPGDKVVFEPVDREEARKLFAGGGGVPAAAGPDSARDSAREREAALTVLDPGLLSTVQDLGRPGWQAFGVSAGGAADREAMRIANALVGNPPDAAVLELTLRGGAYRAEREVLVALFGADFEMFADGRPIPCGCPVRLPAGTVLSFGRPKRGCRAYLAVAGGFDVPPVLGSRSTDLRAGIGGLDGRALRKGDRLPAGNPSPDALRLLRKLEEEKSAAEAGRPEIPREVAFVAHDAWFWDGRPVELRFLPGRSWERFSEGARRAFAEAEYAVSPQSDRMGVRLEEGPELRRADTAETVSHGVVPGAVQVPAGGRPIVLGRDCQPTGGYPIIAHVIRADWWKLAQLRPGDRVVFRQTAETEALRLLAMRERELRLAEAGIRLRWYRP
ncbi:MAG TPA: 5-oxoprolinase subunit PxpB [Paenibacillaceae bacterium]